MKTKPMTSPLPVSLEFFPPKTPEGVVKLANARRELYTLQPVFCSVTFGAGGSTQQGTLDAVRAILAEGIEGAPHLSCVGSSAESIRACLAEFETAGVKRIVALRGDLPSGFGGAAGGSQFRYASDLVAFIRAETGRRYQIEVAAYPETHPQARTPRADLLAFAHKVDAGADSAITQMFFNPDAYFRFVDEARAVAVGVPIVPGIMPITNSSGLMRFADACGTDVPRWIRLRLAAFGDDAASIRAFGLDVVTELCDRLRSAGVPSLHFYTMNQSAATLEICRRLGVAG